MSDDLISRKVLLDSMDKRYKDKRGIVQNNFAEGFMQMEKLIKEQPTAYDLDKVIIQLKENKEDVIKSIRENAESEFSLIKIMDLEQLFEEYTREQIEIVKSGSSEREVNNET